MVIGNWINHTHKQLGESTTDSGPLEKLPVPRKWRMFPNLDAGWSVVSHLQFSTEGGVQQKRVQVNQRRRRGAKGKVFNIWRSVQSLTFCASVNLLNQLKKKLAKESQTHFIGASKQVTSKRAVTKTSRNMKIDLTRIFLFYISSWVSVLSVSGFTMVFLRIKLH